MAAAKWPGFAVRAICPHGGDDWPFATAVELAAEYRDAGRTVWLDAFVLAEARGGCGCLAADECRDPAGCGGPAVLAALAVVAARQEAVDRFAVHPRRRKG